MAAARVCQGSGLLVTRLTTLPSSLLQSSGKFCIFPLLAQFPPIHRTGRSHGGSHPRWMCITVCWRTPRTPGTRSSFPCATDQERSHAINPLRQRQGDSRCPRQPGVPGVGRLRSGRRAPPSPWLWTVCTVLRSHDGAKVLCTRIYIFFPVPALRASAHGLLMVKSHSPKSWARASVRSSQAAL